MNKLRFYFDENVDIAVPTQLKRKGIDVVSVRDLGLLGDNDPNHLQLAKEMGRVLCTHDVDFIVLVAEGIEHAGIFWSPNQGATVGGWIRAILEEYEKETAESMVNQLKYLFVK